MHWENMFREIILNRGYEYYVYDAVILENVTKNFIEAIVSVNKEYEVAIILEHDEIVDMHCLCPYAKKGYNCKHMAVVLYKWKELNQSAYEISNEDHLIDQEDAELSNMIKNTSYDRIFNFLYDNLKNDSKLLTKFKEYINKQNNDINKYKKEINQIVKSYLGRNQFISYYQANDSIYDGKLYISRCCNDDR